MDKNNGLITAVEEFREFIEIYKKDPTHENGMNVRYAELSVIQMAESLVDILKVEENER